MAAVAEVEGKRAPFVIEWRDGFKIGVGQVDMEHRHLFTLVAALNVHSVDRTVEELLDYVVTHFTNEQDLMERSGYPGFEQHLKLHEEFAGQVADFLGNGSEWSEDRVQELRRFLNKWLIGHIMTHDLRFGKWYSAHQAHTAHHSAPAPLSAPLSGSLGFFARLFGKSPANNAPRSRH